MFHEFCYQCRQELVPFSLSPFYPEGRGWLSCRQTSYMPWSMIKIRRVCWKSNQIHKCGAKRIYGTCLSHHHPPAVSHKPGAQSFKYFLNMMAIQMQLVKGIIEFYLCASTLNVFWKFFKLRMQSTGEWALYGVTTGSLLVRWDMKYIWPNLKFCFWEGKLHLWL